jgi:hypothetical protein
MLNRIALFLLWIGLLLPSLLFAAPLSDPCAGPNALLNLIDRPSVADSACAVPNHQVVLEAGYQYINLLHGGSGYNLPEAEFRFGLPLTSELFILTPNYIHQSQGFTSGWADTIIGAKHEVFYTSTQVFALEGALIIPSGSATFGSHALGAFANALYSLNLTKKFNILFEFGAQTLTASNKAGGQRYSTINPDIVLTFSPVSVLDIYGEIYGANHATPNKGWGVNFDGGLVYLAVKNFSVDVEYSNRITGALGNFRNYVGAGFGLLF